MKEVLALSTLIFGHRGYPAEFPENSLEGFNYTLQHHIEGLEFDVHLTKDQVPVICHDETIDRVTTGKGAICQYTLQELQKFKLANGEAIPTLKTFLELVQNKAVQLNLEFKTNIYHYQNIETIVLNLVKNYQLVHPIIYSSFNLKSLQIAYSLDPDQTYCFLADHLIENPQKLATENHLAGFHLNHVQRLGTYPQRIWTVDQADEIQHLLDLNVAGIFTNDFILAEKLKYHS